MGGDCWCCWQLMLPSLAAVVAVVALVGSSCWCVAIVDVVGNCWLLVLLAGRSIVVSILGNKNAYVACIIVSNASQDNLLLCL